MTFKEAFNSLKMYFLDLFCLKYLLVIQHVFFNLFLYYCDKIGFSN